MSKSKDFIFLEKEKFGKIFVDITYAVDDISLFLEEQDLKKRKYYVKLPVLKRYIEILDASIKQMKKKNIFNFFTDDNSTKLVKQFKQDNEDSLQQLEKCCACNCLTCTAQCKFDSCLGCRQGSRIIYCDHQRINVTSHENFTLNLTNNRTGIADKYYVLVTLQDCQIDRKYIIIKNSNTDEKFVLYYYPGIIEDQFGEINDTEEFDFIVSTFESNSI